MSDDKFSVCIDHATKIEAEKVFSVLGLSATDAIRMFYRQVAIQRGLPFVAKIPNAETLAAIKELDEGMGSKSSLKEFKAQLKTIAQ
ncbi:MAG: type II toxin-antitoxin system RelB/DinJ family antitoxin [Magnetococcales bacterium]|nr:type II toxin-antitoxin system RelB/DinJ family antitoxin [Magnetococcales bacterium]